MKKYIISFILFLTYISTYSQQGLYDNVYYPEYTAQTYEMTRMGNIKTKKSIGELDFQIPIHIYEDRDFKIPVILSYVGNGLKPNKKEGVVGHDWVLSLGGSVTREVQGGVEDERDALPGYNGRLVGVLASFQAGLYDYSHQQRTFAQIMEERSLADVANGAIMPSAREYDSTTRESWWNASKFYIICVTHQHEKKKGVGYATLEPNMYYFSMPNHSGRFNFTWDGTVQFMDDKKYKLEYTIQSGRLHAFEITTDDGYIYTFGGFYNAVETTSSFPASSGQLDAEPTMAWKLTKITAPNGRTAEFVYQKYLKETAHYSLNSISKDNSVSGGRNGVEGGHFCYQVENLDKGIFSFHPNQESVKKRYAIYNELYVRESYLSEVKVDGVPIIKIDYASSKGSFYPNRLPTGGHIKQSSRGNNIQEIKIYNLQNNLLKSAGFLYESFNSEPSLDKDMNRLFLSKLKINDEEYSFGYYKTDKLPSPFTFGIDHWGYYNGGDHFLPDLYITEGSSYPISSGREANRYLFDVGMLQYVSYPTGGKTVFEYDMHDYAYALKRTRGGLSLLEVREQNTFLKGVAGGARIKSITDYDQSSRKTNEKTYNYKSSNGNSSGILLQFPEYIADVFAKTSGGLMEAPLYTNPSATNKNLSEKYIQYSDVTEKHMNNGSISYVYTSYHDYPDISISLAAHDEDKETIRFERLLSYAYNWHLMSQKTTDQSYKRGLLKEQRVRNEVGDLLETKSYKYKVLPSSLANHMIAINSSTYMANKFTIENYAFVEDEVLTTQYLNNGTIQKSQSYVYNSRGALEKIIYPTEDREEHYQYPYDKNDDVSRLMVQRNILSPIISKMTYQNKKQIYRRNVIYKKFHNSLLLPSELYESYGSSSNEIMSRKVNRYDIFGNPTHTIDKDGKGLASIWANRGLYLLAKIDNISDTDFDKLYTTSQINEIVDNPMINTEDVKKHIRVSPYTQNSHLTFYDYIVNVGVKQIESPQAIKTSYSYDDFYRLKEAYDMSNNKLFNYKYRFSSDKDLSLPLISYIEQFEIPKGDKYNRLKINVNTIGGTGNYKYDYAVTTIPGNKTIIKKDNQDRLNVESIIEETGSYKLVYTVKDKIQGQSLTKEYIYTTGNFNKLGEIGFVNVIRSEDGLTVKSTLNPDMYPLRYNISLIVSSYAGSYGSYKGTFYVNGEYHNLLTDKNYGGPAIKNIIATGPSISLSATSYQNDVRAIIAVNSVELFKSSSSSLLIEEATTSGLIYNSQAMNSFLINRGFSITGINAQVLSDFSPISLSTITENYGR